MGNIKLCHFCDSEQILYSIYVFDYHYHFCEDCLDEMTADEFWEKLFTEKNYAYPQPLRPEMKPPVDPDGNIIQDGLYVKTDTCSLCGSKRRIRIQKIDIILHGGFFFTFCKDCLDEMTANKFIENLYKEDDEYGEERMREMFANMNLDYSNGIVHGRLGSKRTKKRPSAKKSKERSKMTKSMRYDIMRRDNFHCVLCGATTNDGKQLVVDHIIPIAKNGKTIESNLRTLCVDCNAGKGTKLESESI